MRKPVVDFKEFTFKKLFTPQFSYILWLLVWVSHCLLYAITEWLVPAESCHVIHHKLDDIIPFIEIFVVPYVLWYLLIAITLIYFALYNPDNFKRFNIFILITQIIATLIFIVYPSMQNLRPVEFPRDNIFSDLVGLLYSADTNTNVCPSTHVAYSIGIASAWIKEKSVSKGFKTFIVIFAILICLSTSFIKQHSVIDSFVAVIICILAEFISSGKSYRFPKIRK